MSVCTILSVRYQLVHHFHRARIHDEFMNNNVTAGKLLRYFEPWIVYLFLNKVSESVFTTSDVERHANLRSIFKIFLPLKHQFTANSIQYNMWYFDKKKEKLLNVIYFHSYKEGTSHFVMVSIRKKLRKVNCLEKFSAFWNSHVLMT